MAEDFSRSLDSVSKVRFSVCSNIGEQVKILSQAVFAMTKDLDECWKKTELEVDLSRQILDKVTGMPVSGQILVALTFSTSTPRKKICCLMSHFMGGRLILCKEMIHRKLKINVIKC